jgi:hypothetical protein
MAPDTNDVHDRIGARFAEITSLLEDAHGLAIMGQEPYLSPGEVVSLRNSLKAFSERLDAQLHDWPQP